MLSVIAAFVAMVALVAFAQPANANSVATNGTQDGANSVHYYNTARTDTYAQNVDSFRLDSINNIGGGFFTIALRTTGGTTYARANTGQTHKFVTIVNDNGSGFNPPRTFYTNSEVTGMCGGNGCGAITWTGTISWNVKGILTK